LNENPFKLGAKIDAKPLTSYEEGNIVRMLYLKDLNESLASSLRFVQSSKYNFSHKCLDPQITPFQKPLKLWLALRYMVTGISSKQSAMSHSTS
jgi:hypothetical protein